MENNNQSNQANNRHKNHKRSNIVMPAAGLIVHAGTKNIELV